MLGLARSRFMQSYSKLTFYRKLYLFSLFVLALGLPLSSILTSISQFILFGTWIIEGNFQNKIQKIKTDRILQAFLILPLVHIIWLFNTTDFSYAIHDLKIKIPLLLFPLVIGTIEPLSKKELNWILNTFITGVLLGTVVSIAVYTGIYKLNYTDVRSISLFISHIRFGLMIVLSLVILTLNRINKWKSYSKINRFLLVLLTCWFLTFLIILQSVTSWVVMAVLTLFLIIYFYKKIKPYGLRLALIALISILFTGSALLIKKVHHDFYNTETYNLNNLPKFTKRGNKYFNKTRPQFKENGHYINILICNKELHETWPQVSNIPLNSKTPNNFTVKSTLIRYLSSKGLTKDTEGIMALDKEDIKMIEKGYASCIYRYKFIPYIKIYDLIWEFDRYIKLGDANNMSVAQRFEFLRTARYIVQQNFWMGIGTGDLKTEYKKAYNDMQSKLKDGNRLRTHNQFITFLITFGIVGFLLCLYSIVYPGIAYSGSAKAFLYTFLLIILISMLNEDTMETQAGVTFYIAFYVLLVFSKNQNNE